jgi:hypothetical protein
MALVTKFESVFTAGSDRRLLASVICLSSCARFWSTSVRACWGTAGSRLATVGQLTVGSPVGAPPTLAWVLMRTTGQK